MSIQLSERPSQVLHKLQFRPPPLGCVLCMPGLPGGGGYAHDTSPYGNVGTNTNVTWVMLPSGLWVMRFNGSSSYVDCGTNNSFSFGSAVDFTLLTWFNANLITAFQALFSKRLVDPPRIGYRAFFTPTGGYRLSINDNNYDFPGTYGIGEWHQAAFCFDRDGHVTLYVDGSYSNSAAADVEDVDTSSNLVIGADSPAAASFLNGYLALPRIFNRILPALEIQRMYEQERALFR